MIDDDNEAIAEQLGVNLNAVHENHPSQWEKPPMRPPMNAAQKPRPQSAMLNAEVVRSRRRALGLTQVMLAVMAGTNARTIAQIERNKQLDPPTSVTLRIARALSVTVEALCRGAEPYSARNVKSPLSSQAQRLVVRNETPFDPSDQL